MTSGKTRILHLIASNFVGGPERQILRHAGLASSAAMELIIGSFRHRSAHPEILQRAEDLGLPVLELGPARFGPRGIFQLVDAIRTREISLLCTHGYKANLIGWAACRLTGRRQIAFARGWTAENQKIKFYEALDRIVLRWTDWVVCVSQPLAAEIQKIRKQRTAPLVVPNAALFLTDSVTYSQDRAAFRRSLGQPEDAFLICAVGRLSPEKGHRYLLHAIESLRHRIPNLRLLLLGDGAERRQLEKEAAQLGIDSQVAFAGFQKDVRPWIQACDLLVNPSLREGMPNVVLEAMALGTPVVATEVGGVPQLVDHRNSGLLVPAADSGALAEAVFSIFGDRCLALCRAENARRRLEAYSPEKQTEKLAALYARVLLQSETGIGGRSATQPATG